MENKLFSINGTYTLRQIAGEYLAIPISNAAVENANIVVLNPVSHLIWKELETEKTLKELLSTVTKEFDVPEEEALNDIKEFLSELEKANLLK